MIRLIPFCAALIAAWAPAMVTTGHGLPIHVNGATGLLSVSGGLRLSAGYVTQGFDYHEDAYLDVGPNFTQITSLPGFDLSNMTSGSQLSLEVLPRPDFTDEATPLRWVWFWDQQTAAMDIAPNDPSIRIASQKGFGDVRITQFAPPTTSSTVKILEPNPGEIGSHQHPLLYFLDDAPAAKFGAYGFFVRLTSPNYGSSEPFLITLNHGLSSDEFDDASREINASAALAGDFNGDDVVDGNDFLAWQRSLGSTMNLAADGSLNGTVDGDDLAIWKENFGRTWPAASSTVANVPEPATVALLAGTIPAAVRRRRRSGLQADGAKVRLRSRWGAPVRLKT